jgi:hypothetical protein
MSKYETIAFALMFGGSAAVAYSAWRICQTKREIERPVGELRRISGEIRKLYDAGRYHTALERVGELENRGYNTLGRLIREKIAEKTGQTTDLQL